MQVTDKAVSTNDLENEFKSVHLDELEAAANPTTTTTAKTSPPPHPHCFDLNRLETVLATLIENKVEAIKHQDRKHSSVTSSRKNSIVKRLRITSTSTTSSGNFEGKKEEKRGSTASKRWQRMQPNDSIDTHSSTNCGGPQSQELSISSIESNRLVRPYKSNLKNSPLTSRQSSRETTDDNNSLPPFSRQESRESYPTFSRQDSKDSAFRYAFGRQDSKDSTCRILMKHDTTPSRIAQQTRISKNPCCCEKAGGLLNIQRSFDDDYVSLKIEDELFSDEEALRRARRKRRRKRRRRLRRQLALEAMRGATNLPPKVAPMTDKEDRVKVLDKDDLPPKARWTIVATACVLLFLCLLLVGVTLRMAPLIDDMVRMENEQLINSYNKDGAKLNLTLIRS